MFALIGVTFVILANSAQHSAESQARVEQYAESPEEVLTEAQMQVFRGTNNPASVLRNHGLLEDLYGNDTIPYFYPSGTAMPTPQPNAQIIELPDMTIPELPLVGRVITMLNGPARGQSTRIIGVNPTSGNPQILAFPDVTAVNLNAYMGSASLDFIINGTPFSGTGFGYNPTVTGVNPQLTAQSLDDPTTPMVNESLPYALAPNPVGFITDSTHPAYNANYTDPSGPGGANEDYDAADYQNMLLAMQVVDGTTPPPGTTPIPSLHRPELVNYWFNWVVNNAATVFGGAGSQFSMGSATSQQQWFTNPRATTADGQLPLTEQVALANLTRRILLRPLIWDNPNFTGSNPGFFPLWDGYNALVTDINGDGVAERVDWDVDNDGDGIADSIWVDIGLPARSGKDGKLYKPLVAILCVDLDSRLNINAHGSLAQAVATYYQPETLPAAIAGGGVSQLTTTRGQGVGPAEVNLNALFAVAAGVQAQATNLIQARYGTDRFPGRPDTAGSPYDYPPADPLAANKAFDYPGLYNLAITYDPASNSGSTVYGTPMDLFGMMAWGVDLRGQPLYVGTGGGFFGQHVSVGNRADNPYELNLFGAARGLTDSNTPDSPFTVAELEAVLRPYDTDAAHLPDRITQLAQSIITDGLGRITTTESWDLPTPAVAMPPEMRWPADSGASTRVGNWFPARKGNSLVDLLRARLVAANSALDDPNDTNDVSALDTMTAALFPPDMLAGLRMDVNRPFGNGWDEDGNGVIDEPYEADTRFPQVNVSGTDATTSVLDPDNDGTVGVSAYTSERQLYARHLYVMMLTLMNYDPSVVGPPSAADIARQVAQWAINIVDFRDRDSIMTPFEYDENPFDGWDADGNPGTPNANCGVVWGCERPELLITETLAFHDQRITDTADDPTGKKTDDPDPDDDFDQAVVPRGALFVEIYNPATTNEPRPNEFYEGQAGIRLWDTVGGSPIWRMLIVTGASVGLDPDDPDNPPSAADVTRSIYFVQNLPATTDLGVDGYRYLPESGSNMAMLLPDRYLVIGPGDATNNGITRVGQTLAGIPNDPNDRQIVLQPNTNADQDDQVDVVNNGKTTPTADVPAGIKPAIAFRYGDLNVSAPVPGDPDETVYAQPFTQVFDQPFDYQRAATNPAAAMFAQPGTAVGRFRIHLQRLANPLLPYDAQTNPYRTIDSMPIDVTTFNGSEVAHDPIQTWQTIMFESHQRGETATAGTYNLWAQPLVAKPIVASAQEATPMRKFPYILQHSLGYLTDDFGPPLTGPYNFAGTPPYDYRGSPQQPFPWFTWLNRPFVSPAELMLVPTWRSSELLAHFDGTAATTQGPYLNAHEPFGQLTNYLYDNNDPTTGHPPTATPNWKLHRLLEFVRVPSRFVGTELQGNPAGFTEAGANNHSFHPPFNRISQYREPGKVNLNTIASSRVLAGLTNFLGTPTVANFVQSRQGYTSAAWYALDTTNYLPTRFANPFRSFAGRYLVPLQPLQQAVERNGVAAPNPADPKEINATLLRPAWGSTTNPLFRFTSAQAANNTNRNPAFRYQLLNRLESVATTRSNVYAVWITVGYFEVESATYSDGDTDGDDDITELTLAQFGQVYPDGYRLGAEVGSDTGEVKRHRSFSIFDRSIPVGFQRGEDRNVEKAILLRRVIE